MKQLLLSILMMLLPLLANAEAVEINGIYYNLSTETNTAEVTKNPNYYSGEIVIPESVNYEGTSYSVTSIGVSAFDYSYGLTSVTISNSVTSIGNWAFNRCSSLTSVTIPNSVTSIGGKTFSGCSGLTSVTIPNSVTSIGYGAFSFCDNLVTIKVENGNTIYDSRNNCNAIIRTADNELIVGCSNTFIPNSVTSIGSGAFLGCRGLTSVTIPESVTSIGDLAFDETAWYESQPDGLVYAGKVAYQYKGTMPDNTNITLKEGTLGIANGTFYGCSGLTSVTIPNSVKNIGEEAFRECI